MLINTKTGMLITGKVAKDPETKATQANTVTKFSVLYGYDGSQKDDQGRRLGKFMNVDMWGAPGETAASILQKGDHVLVAGELKTNEYEGKTYYSLNADIVIPSLTVIDALIPAEVAGDTGCNSEQASAPGGEFLPLDEDDGDLPF